MCRTFVRQNRYRNLMRRVCDSVCGCLVCILLYMYMVMCHQHLFITIQIERALQLTIFFPQFFHWTLFTANNNHYSNIQMHQNGAISPMRLHNLSLVFPWLIYLNYKLSVQKKKKNTQPSIWNNQLLFALSFEFGAIFEWLDAACQSDKVIPLGWPLMTPTWNIKLLQLFLHGLISDRNEKRPHKCNENEINNIRFDWLSQYRLRKWT